MLMHNFLHPGEVIRRWCLAPPGLTAIAAAKGLGVSRNALPMLLNGRLEFPPEMAIRLSKRLGDSPESGLQQQMQYDLWHTKQRAAKITVRKFEAV